MSQIYLAGAEQLFGLLELLFFLPFTGTSWAPSDISVSLCSMQDGFPFSQTVSEKCPRHSGTQAPVTLLGLVALTGLKEYPLTSAPASPICDTRRAPSLL